ncbi:MAG: response regulator transcription factor [Candidatus Pacebacteria bacterium]|nr:response regulator transcription factor [Candidatus Paceibacterota bacterium]
MPNKNILLVEDDPFLADIYTKKLQQAGFDVTVADNGEQALKDADNVAFDLVLLDIVMPYIDGWEILKRIKSPKAKNHPKVIIFSNLGQSSEVKKGLDLGADKYLIKANFTPSEVVEEIKKVIL